MGIGMMKYQRIRKKTSLFSLLFCTLFITLFPGLTQSADTPLESTREADQYLVEGSYMKAVAAYNQILAAGLVSADIYRNQSIAFYELRLLDDAILAMEKGVELLPDSTLFRMELGMLYAAQNRLDEAKDALFAVLAQNPGLAEAYYFLGDVFYKQGQYRYGWFAAKTSQKLGFDASILLTKLALFSQEPSIYPWQKPGPKLAFRKLLFTTREEAAAFLDRISQGELFEYAVDDDTAALTLGGYAGEFVPEELQQQLAAIFDAREPFSPPMLFESEEGYFVIQRLLPFHFAQWQSLLPPDGTIILPSDHPIEVSKQRTQPDEYGPLLHLALDYNKIRVYAGSFFEEERALRSVQDLRKLHFPAFYLTTLDKEGKTRYNVTAGHYNTRSEALAVSGNLKKHGYSSFVSSGPSK